MNRLLLAGLLAASFAPVAAQAQSFQGPYVGVQAGWNHETAINDKRDSAVGGAFAGYDYQITPNIVLGAEAGFSIASSDRIGPSGTNSATVNPLHSFDLSARAGYVVGERNLLYVRGGYANTRARVETIASNVLSSDQRTFDGWFVGGGAERKLLDNVSARLEYRYSDLGADNRKYERSQVLVGVAYRF